MLKKKKEGFTLIEIVAVIAILIILAVALVPQVSKYIDRSKVAAVQSQCREIVTAVEFYNSEKSTDLITKDTKLSEGTTGILEKIEELKDKKKDKLKTIPEATTYEKIKKIAEGTESVEIDDGKLVITEIKKTE